VQLSVAVTSAFTLAAVGNVAGLQPRLLPDGYDVITGTFVSTIHEYTTFVAVDTLPHSSAAVIVNVLVIIHPLVTATSDTLTFVTVQLSVATTCAFTPATVGRLVGLGLHPKFVPIGTLTNCGAVLSIVQVYTTVTGWQVLPHSSVAVMLKVRVVPHAVVTSWLVTLMLATVQLSVAVTSAFTLAAVGKVVGLQPKFPPGGYDVIVGTVLSIVQVYTTVTGWLVWPHSSVAVMLKVLVVPHTVVTSWLVTLMFATVQSSVAATCSFTLAAVGNVAGLQPKLLPGGYDVITGTVLSIVQVYTTVTGRQVFPHSSVAVMLNVRVVPQAVVTSA